MSDSPKFAMFVQAKAPALVTRFGTARPGVQSYIGAYRKPGAPDEVVFTDDIVPLTDVELMKYGREYRRELEAGNLVECTREEWEEQVKERAEADKRAAAKREADAKAEAEKAQNAQNAEAEKKTAAKKAKAPKPDA